MSNTAVCWPHGACPTVRRKAASTGLTALIAGLALAASAQADTLSGSASFELRSGYFGGETIDFSALPELSKLQFTSVRATFSAYVLGDMHEESQPPADYSLRNSERAISTPPNCYNLPVAWCGVERYYYTRDVVKTLTQSELARLQVRVGGVGGDDDLKGTLTESSLLYQATTRDERRESFLDRSDPASPGLMEVFRYYESNDYLHRVWSNKTQLSVTLDLDAATLAEMSSTGLLRYDGFAHLIFKPTLRLDYVAVSAVPEPGSAAMALAGLALLAGVGFRQRFARR